MASKSEKKPPTTSSDGHESHRWREGAAAPQDAEIALFPDQLLVRYFKFFVAEALSIFK
tara:strand:- start:125 stop:301 length:177 start_codon:yes stop_codon:yes gene_type:complete